jgi:hypothetical protein
MKFVASAAALAALAAPALADVTTTCTATKTDVVTQWMTVTAYKTINDCSPISTVVTPCSACAPCTVTAWTQPITSTTTSSYPTSTYARTAGYYEECSCQIASPQWIYFDTPCEVEYSCPYQDWYFMNTKTVYVHARHNGQDLGSWEEHWDLKPTMVPSPVVTYFPTPTVVVINDITINVTVAPTYITYTTTATSTVTSVSTVTATPTGVTNPGAGTPVQTFKLVGTLNGQEGVIVQQGGNLVFVPGDSTTGVAFTLTSTGELMTANGQYVSLTFANGNGSPFVYGAALRKRDIADGTYFGIFSGSGSFGMSINGTTITIQICGANALSGSDNLMDGCTQITLTITSVNTPISSGISSAPSSAPASSPSSAPSSIPTPASGFPSSSPSFTGTIVPASALPSNIPSAPISYPTIIPTSDLPSGIQSLLPTLLPSSGLEIPTPLPSILPSGIINDTLVLKKARMARGVKFVYAH